MLRWSKNGGEGGKKCIAHVKTCSLGGEAEVDGGKSAYETLRKKGHFS